MSMTYERQKEMLNEKAFNPPSVMGGIGEVVTMRGV